MKIRLKMLALLSAVFLLTGLVVGQIPLGATPLEPTPAEDTPAVQAPVVPSAAVGTILSDDPSYTCVAANDTLSLFANLQDGSFAVRTAGGALWYSNPADRADDPIAQGAAKTLLNSQVNITYYNAKSQSATMDSYHDCLQNEGLTASATDTGFVVQYTFGDGRISYEMLPTVFTQERFENEILPQATDESHRKYLIRYYELLEKDGMDEESYQESREKYPTLEQDNLYVLEDTAPPYAVKGLYEFYKSIGYTEETVQQENARHGVIFQLEESLRFTLTVRYTLDSDSLSVTVDCAAIDAPAEYYLTDVALLPYFGAANGSAQGYILLPDGSGTLVEHNNGKKGQSVTLPLYGRDVAKSGSTLEDAEKSVATLPVYGIQTGEQGMLCVIEQGDAHATLETRGAGIQNNYNYGYVSYDVWPHDGMSLAGNSESFNVYQSTPYQGEICQRFFFLDGAQSGYAGMAARYQRYLEEQGTIRRLTEEGYSFVLETLGAFEKKQTFLGIPYTGTVALTTYEQTGELMALLQERGVESLTVKLSGWYNKGLLPGYSASVKPISALGGKAQLLALQQQAQQRQARLYVGNSVQLVNEGLLSLRYPSWSASSRNISKEIVVLYPQNLATGLPDDRQGGQYLLSPSRLAEVLEDNRDSRDFLPDATAFYEDLGRTLYGDYDKNQTIDRQRSAALIGEALRGEADGYGITGGNVYALAGASLITQLRDTSSRFFAADHSVPFVQMVLHGYVDYAGEAINLQSDNREALLQTATAGGLLYYVWSYQNTDQLKDTTLQRYSITHYQSWLEEAAQQYRKLQSVLAPLRTCRMVDYQWEQGGDITVTTYENGTKVIVNRSDAACRYGEHTVPPRDMIAVKGGTAA